MKQLLHILRRGSRHISNSRVHKHIQYHCNRWNLTYKTYFNFSACIQALGSGCINTSQVAIPATLVGYGVSSINVYISLNKFQVGGTQSGCLTDTSKRQKKVSVGFPLFSSECRLLFEHQIH